MMLPSVKVDQKTLITYRNILSFIQNGNFVEHTSVTGKIRPVNLKSRRLVGIGGLIIKTGY